VEADPDWEEEVEDDAWDQDKRMIYKQFFAQDAQEEEKH
jgi:hypothetical protein